MLTELRIRNVGVIDDVTLHLGPGLNVLTGETGAGKTMVVSALELLLGARADAGRVRAGTGSALVECGLRPVPEAAQEWVEDGDDELIAAREVSADPSGGRSRARLGGRMAPVSALSACVGAAVELHGQSDTFRLAQPAVQRELLDRFGGAALAATAEAYRQVFDAWTAARAELDRLRDMTRDRVREADRLRFELGEIDAVAPLPDEDEALLADLARLEHAESLLAAAGVAAAAIADDGGAHDVLAAAAAALEQVADVDPALRVLTDRARSLTAEAQDVGLELHGYLSDLEADPVRLDVLRARYSELLRLSRKYSAAGADLDLQAVVAYADQARALLVELDGGEDRIAELEERVRVLEASLEAAAGRLRDERRRAGTQLAEVVGEHLAELAMSGARLEVQVAPTTPAASGADRVVFLLAANPGEPALPLGKAASGGERSRVALGLRLALADADDTAVLVFDEVDAGIGGGTAVAVGRKLARLARGRQVLCVTHLPQLAAYADVHFGVRKSQAGGRTVATVAVLDDAQRVAELSRMLSGSTDSAVAADHAAELLSTARDHAASAR